MMKNYAEDELKRMSYEELKKELDFHEWYHRDLLREYDERHFSGKIPRRKAIKPEDLEEHFRKKRELKERKKAS